MLGSDRVAVQEMNNHPVTQFNPMLFQLLTFCKVMDNKNPFPLFLLIWCGISESFRITKSVSYWIRVTIKVTKNRVINPQYPNSGQVLY